MASEPSHEPLADWLQKRNEEQVLEWLNEVGFCFGKPEGAKQSANEEELPKAA
jgi:hypothetical protein